MDNNISIKCQNILFMGGIIKLFKNNFHFMEKWIK